MKVSFKFALNDVEFDARIDYLADDLHFNSAVDATQDNIEHVIARYKTIDRVHRVDLVCCNRLQIHYISTDDGPIPISKYTPPGFFASQELSVVEFGLNALILFYPSGPIIEWQIDRDVPDWIMHLVKAHCEALNPVVIGTAHYVLPSLKESAKATVKANARRRANIMLGNAQAILEFLGEVV